MIERTPNPEIARLVDDAFDLDNVDSEAGFYIKQFTRPGGVEQKNKEKQSRLLLWNIFVRDLKERQKTVKETGRLVKGERNRLTDMLEGFSYGWPDEETGELIPVVDIRIDGYRATRKNDLGAYYSRTTPVTRQYSQIVGVECEIFASPDPKELETLTDLGICIVRACVEVPDIFKGDEEHIFVPADRLLTVPVQPQGRYSNTGNS